MSDRHPTNHSKFNSGIPSKDNFEYIENIANSIGKMNMFVVQIPEEQDCRDMDWHQISQLYSKISTDFDNVDWPETTEAEALEEMIIDLGALVKKKAPRAEIVQAGERIDKLLYIIVHAL